jgi:hypothetical protein
MAILVVMCMDRSRHIVFTQFVKERQLTWSDAEGYYMYLPAIFIYQNFIDVPIRSTSQFHRIESTGAYFDKYTFGVAFMQLPFWLVADIYARNSSYPRDGYSRPYQLSIFFASFFYAMTGLFIMFKLLRKKYGLVLSLLVTVCIFYGTNLMYYSTVEAGMSHSFSFFLVNVLVALTPAFYQNRSIKYLFLLAVVVSLMVFARPTNAIAVLYLLLYRVNDRSNLFDRVRYGIEHIPRYIFLAVPFVIFGAVQVLLWKEMRGGEVVLYSYDAEPGFIYWSDPKFWKVLFSVQNGLFIYAPILLFGLVGIVYGAIKNEPNYRLLLGILFIYTYVFASWWAWWFGGAYGHRCYVDLLIFFAFPMAHSFQYALRSKKKIVPALTWILIFVFVFYSIRMTSKYTSPWDGPDWNWETWFEVVKNIF